MPVSDVLPLLAAHLLGARVAAPRRHLLITPEVIGRAAGARQRLRTTSYRPSSYRPRSSSGPYGCGRWSASADRAPAVPAPLVAADLDLATDVGLDLTAQVPLDAVGRVDTVTQTNQVLLGQLVHASVRADP